MNLLEFLESQNKESWLHHVPLEVKIIVLVVLALLLSWFMSFIIYLLTLILVIGLFLSIKLHRFVMSFLAMYSTFCISVIAINYLLGVEILLVLMRLTFALIIALFSLLIVATTNVETFERFLIRLRLPKKVIMSLIVTYNILPSYYAEVQKTRAAQLARGATLSKNPFKLVFQIVYLVIPMFFLAIIRSEVLRKSILARGG